MLFPTYKYYLWAGQRFLKTFFRAYDSSKYMSFLLQAGLVIIENSNFKITNFGVDFLTWLQRTGFPEDKPL